MENPADLSMDSERRTRAWSHVFHTELEKYMSQFDREDEQDMEEMERNIVAYVRSLEEDGVDGETVARAELSPDEPLIVLLDKYPAE